MTGRALAGCALLLGGCDAIYDDTKGWANRLEASILDAAHKMGEPAAEKAPEAMAVPASETPPAVPVEAVDTAALPAPPLATNDTPALSAPGPGTDAASGTPDGLMAEAAKDLTAPAPAPAEAAKTPEADQAKSQEKLPPKPLPKPQTAAAPDAAPEPAAADPAVAMVLHLSSLRSEEAAKREWSDLQRSFPEPLGQMQAEFRRTDLGDKGAYYRVLAGPLPSRDAARQVCADLKAKKARQYCRIMPSQPQS
jgi:hypothetical protein